MDVVNTLFRQGLLFGHLILFALALATIAREDLHLLTSRRVDARALKKTAGQIAWLLALLWISGLALIALDHRLDLAELATAKPKLAAKLTVVSVLTINGFLLHWVAFPLLTRPRRRPHRAAAICAVLGAVSSVTWMYASFVGVARLIAPLTGYYDFVALYLLGLAGGLFVALVFVRPRIVMLIQQNNIDKAHERNARRQAEIESGLQRERARASNDTLPQWREPVHGTAQKVTASGRS
jgi:hypothetical protein